MVTASVASPSEPGPTSFQARSESTLGTVGRFETGRVGMRPMAGRAMVAAVAIAAMLTTWAGPAMAADTSTTSTTIADRGVRVTIPENVAGGVSLTPVTTAPASTSSPVVIQDGGTTAAAT